MLTVHIEKVFVIWVILFVALCAQKPDPRAGYRSGNITNVRLSKTKRSDYGMLEVYVEGSWTAVCDDSFNDKSAKVACQQLNFQDGRFQPGSAVGRLQAPLKAIDFNCNGGETQLVSCPSQVSDNCLSTHYLTLFCSQSTIIEKESPDIRIKDGMNYGLVEANLYGFWGPVCNYDWTDLEADSFCQELGKPGGYAYYAVTESDIPMIIGGFNCSDDDDTLSQCSFKGIGESLGCQYPITEGKRRAAGVFCYEHKDGVKFSLSDRWYGKVQVKHNGEWGRVCNANWGDKEASTMCRQLGYVDGRADYAFEESGGKVRMNNVNCSGSESSVMECSHHANWQGTLNPCNDARVICNTTVCGSMDIRNNVKNLMRLENCTVIEGNLTILLIDTGKWEDYQKYSFPNLVEITEFLLLFRVIDLRSLNHLFPNLAIIRGDRLFSDYALVAFEMPDLVELGLSSLVSIPRGAVRLEKNPNLCYIETVDWAKITTSVSMADNYFKGNKDVQECVNRCPDTCAKTIEFDKEQHRCWTINDCQKMLTPPSNCPSGFYFGSTCCDSNCIAGCTGPSPQQCTACNQVMQYTGNGLPTCTKRCTAGTYMYKERRCLLDWECLNFKDYRTVICPANVTGMVKNCLKLIVSEDKRKPGLCLADCPAGYNTDPNNQQKCVKCKGKCPKICTGKIIDSVNSAQELKGCNIVQGPLHIKLMQGGQIAQELETNLAQIEEVTHYIMISHSEALISLHFFKSLRRIGGEGLAHGKYAFYAYDNLHLQELFLEDVTKNLTIGNGSVLFQYNRKLCFNKIKTFISAVGLDVTKLNPEEVSPDNNGDQMPCDIQKLKLRSLKVSPHIAFVEWTEMNVSADARHLIGYTISWKISPEKNVSIYKGRDACSDDLWMSKDVCTDKPCKRLINYIAGLEPWTQYAAYVRALTVSKALQGAISDVIYFRTAAEVPTSPVNLQVKAKVAGELEVTWDPPNKPNGNVTHYQVYWQLREFDQKEYELRNYCTNPLTGSLGTREKEEKEEEKKNVTIDGTCCACPKTEKQLKVEERERNLEIQFQDYLQNQVYVKRLEPAATTMSTKKRPRRSVPSSDSHEVKKYTYQSSLEGTVTLNLTTMSPYVETTPPTVEKEKEVRKENPYMMADVIEKRKFIISNLGHFEDYNIEVIACHTRETDKDMLCSNQALGFGRTLPDSKADSINASLVEIKYSNRTGAIEIKWQDPAKPNGLILTYDIEYMNVDINNVKPNLICITYEMYRDDGKGGYTLDKLDAGNYTFRLRATSLAGNGSWTDYLTFTIPDQHSQDWTKNTTIAVILSIIAVLFVITVVLVWFITKKRIGKQLLDGMLVSTNPDYMPNYEVYEPDQWEVDRDNVQLLKPLGHGSFGMVFEGLVTLSGGEKIPVAVKTTNNSSNDHDRYQFLQEASIMKQFNCFHVVKLIGVVSQGQPAYVLMELMSQGDLKNFLRLHRPDEEDNNGRQPPTLKQILLMAGEIADGMAYLADKKYVHRDLAARNCMVGADMTVKIGDFGMTRDIYETDYYRKGNRGFLPVRWMAPESIRDGVFTSMTDVWSYGVVLWEMATLAAQPYQGLSNEEVLRYVGSAKIMDTPERCPTKLYDLMVKCWRFRPKQRPTFKEIIEILLPDLDPSFREVSYFFSEENAKYEEAQHNAGVVDNRDEYLEAVDEEDDMDPHCPMNDYVDEVQLPMLGVGASNGHSVELQDIFSDTGTYPHYGSSHNRQHDGSAEMCDCNFREQAGAAAQSSVIFNRPNVCSSPSLSAKGGSSDGSKESSKSSNSSYAHMNGVSVANGHVPIHLRTTPC